LPSVAARAVSSAGRAPALHAGGRRFESCTAHSHSERRAGSAQPRDSFQAISAEIAVPCRPGADLDYLLAEGRPLETGHWRMRMFVLRTHFSGLAAIRSMSVTFLVPRAGSNRLGRLL